MNEMGLAPARAEERRQGRRGVRRRLQAVLTAFVVAALVVPWTGCSISRNAFCYGSTVEESLLDIQFGVSKEPFRHGGDQDVTDLLYLRVGHRGEAVMWHDVRKRWMPKDSRCRSLAADDLAEVVRAIERLERSVVAERRFIRPGCRAWTNIILRGDPLIKKFGYCGTPPAEVVRFVETISEPLGRRFGKGLAAGLAATAPWASPVPLDQPGG